jgi:hypothetical protein
MKPANFHDLPFSLREELLWDMDLDYEPYESSTAEEINNILHSTEVMGRNKNIIESYWNSMSEETFQLKVQNEIEGHKQQLKALKKLLDKSK